MKKIALEFTNGTCLAIEKLIKEHLPFEYIPCEQSAVFVLSKDVAKLFLNKHPFKCKELEIVHLSDLPRKEASKIRKTLGGINK